LVQRFASYLLGHDEFARARRRRLSRTLIAPGPRAATVRLDLARRGITGSGFIFAGAQSAGAEARRNLFEGRA
jgi:hypothetical protein